MSGGRQRNLRLQGKYTTLKQTVLSRSAAQCQAQAPDPLNDSPGMQMAEPALSNLVYTRTDYEIEEKPKGPVHINDDPGLFRKWITVSQTENGDSQLYYDPDFFLEEKAVQLMAELQNSPNFTWQERDVVVYGVRYPQPRLVHWIGPYKYKYSSLTLEPNNEWPFAVREILEVVMSVPAIQEMEGSFNSVLLNLYRDGNDSVAWHTDNELAMGVKPLIASVSLGATRKFELMRKESKDSRCEGPRYSVHLGNGDLLIMNGALQDDWLHRVPKEYHHRKARINLTFRTVYKL